MPEPEKVRAMFASIAPRYDLLNRTLSMGIDVRWRKRVLARAREVPRDGPLRVLDVCTGTGDLALAFSADGARVVGVDFTRPMLLIGAEKRGDVAFVEGDALALPAREQAFDVATVAFGLRNTADHPRALSELARAVRPGGRVLVLEFSTPRSRIFAGAYRFYFHRVLPRVGGWVSRNPAAYRYLPESVDRWPGARELQFDFEAAGLVDCGFERLTGGIACLHYGTRPHV
ncbi:MAG: class I SAM-dependent methyltransferase [Planctomycetota bacterium]